MQLKLVMTAALAAACGTVASVQAAAVEDAKTFPNKPLRILVGPGPDIVGRLIGQKFTEAWGQQVVVETRPGGGGAIAVELVAKATPDGYTLLLGSAAYTINAVLQPAVFGGMTKHFAPVAFCASAPFVLLVHPSVAAKSVQELVALAKAKPGGLYYASSGNGTPPHIAGEMFKSMAGVNIVHVPYKNAAPALIDVVGGQVQMMFAITSIGLPQVQTGKVRGLAVSSAKRTPLAPNLPTIAESGYAGYEVIGWNGLLAPAGTPRAIVAKLNAEAMRALAQPELVQRLQNAFYDASAPNTPEQFAAYMKQEIAAFTKVVKDTGARID